MCFSALVVLTFTVTCATYMWSFNLLAFATLYKIITANTSVSTVKTEAYPKLEDCLSHDAKKNLALAAAFITTFSRHLLTIQCRLLTGTLHRFFILQNLQSRYKSSKGRNDNSKLFFYTSHCTYTFYLLTYSRAENEKIPIFKRCNDVRIDSVSRVLLQSRFTRHTFSQHEIWLTKYNWNVMAHLPFKLCVPIRNYRLKIYFDWSG